MRANRIVGEGGDTPASRETAAEGASLRQVYFQQGKALVPSEWNLIGTIAAERDSTLLGAATQPGFADRLPLTNPSGFTLAMPADYANVGGEPLRVDRGDGGGSSILLSSPPGSGTRYDAVYLEAYLVEVSAAGALDATSHTLPHNGAAGLGADLATDPAYAIKDPGVPGTETSRRLQTRWQLRVTEGVDYATYPRGLGDGLCAGQGAAGSPVSGATFASVDGDPAHFRAGSGTPSDAAAFGASAGYTWAIPVAIVRRQAGQTTLPTIIDTRRSASRSTAIVTPTGDMISIIGRGAYTVGRQEANTWRQFNFGAGAYGGIGFWSIAGATLDTPLTSFVPFFPSHYRLAPGYKLQGRIYGNCIRPPANGADSEDAGPPKTFGLRLRAPNQTYGAAVTQATWSLTREVNANGGLQRLEDALPAFDIATDGSQDGNWTLEALDQFGDQNGWNTMGIWLRVYATEV